ncbi:hypothetical protein ILUMI_03519 [Ignelater luminosus]|uniref:Uncharacterized protein n=1 Tax=Ignelater luminosus TaxID=2038154 RepID=A0A8K0DEH6_IGNLU|nr:hypothetical protein ILUMI_03519 [Ignelater luminosus]
MTGESQQGGKTKTDKAMHKDTGQNVNSRNNSEKNKKVQRDQNRIRKKVAVRKGEVQWLEDKAENLLNENTEIVARWQEYFVKVFNGTEKEAEEIGNGNEENKDIEETPMDMFEQHDYSITFERVGVSKYNKEYLRSAKIVTFKYNRTQAACNGTLDLLKDLGNDIEIIAQAYTFLSNEYRLFPLRLAFNLCEALNKNEFGLNTVFQHGNFTGCPIKPLRYVINKWVPDQKKFPPYIPNGDYRIYLEVMHSTVEIATANFYGIVSRPLGRRH